MENLLGFELEKVKENIKNQEYIIGSIKFLNNPPGIPRVVRITQEQPQTVHMLVVYENTPNNF